MIVTQAQIIELEEQLRQAMLRSDVVELDALIAPELLFTNHLGQVLAKVPILMLTALGNLSLPKLHHPSSRFNSMMGLQLLLF
jgi:hypothetical protein